MNHIRLLGIYWSNKQLNHVQHGKYNVQHIEAQPNG